MDLQKGDYGTHNELLQKQTTSLSICHNYTHQLVRCRCVQVNNLVAVVQCARAALCLSVDIITSFLVAIALRDGCSVKPDLSIKSVAIHRNCFSLT